MRKTLHPDRTICANMTVIDLSSAIIAAHIHVGGPGVDGPAIIHFEPETDGVWRSDCGFFSEAGQEKLTKAQVELLHKGKLYINVHTDNFGPGEVRGQIHK